MTSISGESELAAPPPSTPASPSLSRWRAIGGFGGLGRLLKEQIKRPFYALYRRRLEAKASSWKKPQHIGFIMDGNRRFARGQGFATANEGHHHGASKLQQVLSWCFDAGIPVTTVWSFSIDNFERDTAEVKGLLDLFEQKTREMIHEDQVHSNRVQVRYIGQLSLLPESLREAIQELETATAHYDQFRLNIAMAYGGREEITDAFRSYLRDHEERGESLDQAIEGLDEEGIEPYLYTSGLPEPDLILRTSGELRLSGFLLWQSAHSEYYFCDACWPAFRKIDFLRALRSFHVRHRRYGR
ncbi:MAG: polyprenyl diphosphate synthase [Acidobacteriota bacterium]